MRYFILTVCTLVFGAHAQDTYSIVAVDPETGEVGSAGASCVDLNQFSPIRRMISSRYFILA